VKMHHLIKFDLLQNYCASWIFKLCKLYSRKNTSFFFLS